MHARLFVLLFAVICGLERARCWSQSTPTGPHRPTLSTPLQTQTMLDVEANVPRFRKQFFQGFDVRTGFAGELSSRETAVHQTFEEVRASFGVPLLSLDNLLAVSPSFRIDHLNGPNTSDLDVPETLYNVGVTFFNRRQWTSKLSTLILVTPSVRSDFTTSENAYRTFGLGLLNWQWREDFAWTIGAVFLDRADFGVLPAIGATWTPKPWWRVELTMPRPRVARRLWKQGAEAECWSYVGFGIGGNTWSVTREIGNVESIDELSLRSIDLQFGVETIRAGNRGWFAEGGYAFARQLEYESDEFQQDLSDALFIRAGIQF
ncbi:MAG: hypothetical protein AAF802_06205 [Planctomycetota bacterium]